MFRLGNLDEYKAVLEDDDDDDDTLSLSALFALVKALISIRSLFISGDDEDEDEDDEAVDR